jgi:hypothetical protein
LITIVWHLQIGVYMMVTYTANRTGSTCDAIVKGRISSAFT